MDFVSISLLLLCTIAGDGETDLLVRVVFGVSLSDDESFLIGEYADRIVSPVGVTGAEILASKFA